MSKRTAFWRKVMASTLAYTLAFGQVAPAAYGASVDISAIPLAVKYQVPPNIMMTLDDSGSMQWEFLPDEQMRFSIFMYPRPNNPYGGSTYDNQVPNFNDNNIHNFFGRSSHNNKSYYNPDVTYRPWSNPDGSLRANADPSAALYNPSLPGVGSLDLLVQRTQSANWFSHTTNIDSASCDPGCPANHTYWPMTYFKYNGSGSLTARASYTKVEIRNTTPASTTYNYTIFNADGTTSVGTRTKAQEVQNFANWFQYSRSRVLQARAGIGRAFSRLPETPRIGFGSINTTARTIDGVASPGTVASGVRPFTGAARTSFFNSLYDLPIAAAGTPLRQAADDVGQYFLRTDHLGPWGQNPGVGGGTQLSCRSNYHILMTDGYWNEGFNPARTAAARANVDGTSWPTHTGSVADPVTGVLPTFTYSPANPWSDSRSDTLADVAMYYWLRDLRPDLPNNVPPNPIDPAFWQHLTTFGVALGVFGNIPLATIRNAFRAPYPTINWPNPIGSDAAKIDDLAHAAVNTRGGFFSATDPEELGSSLAAALSNIAARLSAASAVGITAANVVSGDNTLFTATYLPGLSWSGDVTAVSIDPATGVPGTTPHWTAQAQLDARTPESRFIVSYTGQSGSGRGVRFRPVNASGSSKLTNAQTNLLNTPGASPQDGEFVIAYLRGDRSLEGTVYRDRNHLLGPIIRAQPVVVRPPEASYSDAGYSAFKTANASRRQILLQGANAGMLHAFDAGTAPVGATAGTPGTGAELWAYVPNLVIPTLNNLSRITGYEQLSYVDATPVVEDVDFNKTPNRNNATPDWRTLAVGGLGKGGRGYYALDVTSTTAATEEAAASKVLWEFPNDDSSHTPVKLNIGWSFGKPIVTKTALGWVVLVASGYNNGTNPGDSGGTGRGYLFVLDASTGELIRAIDTGAGTATTPSGLAFITGYAENSDINNTVEFVYGGDALGNVWRFDLRGTTAASWSVRKLAQLVDASGNFQPVTSEPELAKIKIGGVDRRFVYIGTGLLLGDTDLPGSAGANAHASQTQTMYGLVDDLSTPALPNAVISPLRANLQRQQLNPIAAGNGNRSASGNPVNFATQRGWYVDLPDTGERINTSPVLGVGALVFTSNVPSADSCNLGGSSFFNVLDYQTGGIRAGDPTIPSSVRFANTHLSAPVLIRLKSGKMVGLVQDSNAKVWAVNAASPATGSTTKRRSWRELLR